MFGLDKDVTTNVKFFVCEVCFLQVLMLLFTVTENTDLLGLHFRQRSADQSHEKSTAATGWIRGLGSAVKRRLEEEDASLLMESDVDTEGSEKKTTIIFG
jgi:hypothetical protein